MPEPITRGNTLRADLLVQDDLGALVDPTTLTLTIKTPGNVTTILTYPTAAIVRTSLGIYYSDIVLTEIGIWEYEWVTTLPDRAEGEQIYVEADPINSAPSVSSVVDYTRLYMGGENWSILTTSPKFGVEYVILGIEVVKRRVLVTPPSPSEESALHSFILDYLGILSALQLLPACRDAWASKVISRSVGADPTEITTYTDRSKRIDDLKKDLLEMVDAIYAKAKPHLDEALNIPSSMAAIDEAVNGARITADPRTFPPATTFPYQPDEVVTLRWP